MGGGHAQRDPGMGTSYVPCMPAAEELPMPSCLLPCGCRHVVEKLSKKNKNATIKPFMVKNHLWIFVNCYIENPAFDSQVRSLGSMMGMAHGVCAHSALLLTSLLTVLGPARSGNASHPAVFNTVLNMPVSSMPHALVVVPSPSPPGDCHADQGEPDTTRLGLWLQV